MPSTGEGFGIVFLEALASGIPAIGGNQDGSVDSLCDNGISAAIDPDNEDELISAILRLIDARTTDDIFKNRFKLHYFADQVSALLKLIECRSKQPLFSVGPAQKSL
jgi:phosphatidylinositol alpha-1,6-mannosyltransferase